MLVKRFSLICFFAIFPTISKADGLHICATNGDPQDVKDIWENYDAGYPNDTWKIKSITIPAGTIFDSTAPSQVVDGFTYNYYADVISTESVTLTKNKPCADVPGEAVISSKWRDVVSPIFGDGKTTYDFLGVMQDGELKTNFDSSSYPVDSFYYLLENSVFNFTATVNGTLDKTFVFDNDNQ